MAQGGTGRLVTLKRIVSGCWLSFPPISRLALASLLCIAVKAHDVDPQARVLLKAISVPTTSNPYLFDAQFCKRMVWGFSLQGA